VTSPLVRHLAVERHVDLGGVQGTGPGGSITRGDIERVSHASAPPAPPEDRGRIRASPLARSRARRRGLDLRGVPGTGPGGAVVEADLASAAATPATAGPAPGTTSPTGRRADAVRRSVGQLMARSAREVPHYYLASTIDLQPALDWLAGQNQDRPVAERVLPAALLARAVVVACAAHPLVNGHWVDGAFRPSEVVDLGVAVRLRGGGVVSPVVADAGQLSVPELMARLRQVVERARSGRLLASEMAGPTITITNLGDRGADSVLGVISPPQVALVGFGRIAERPWVVDGEVVARSVVTASLAADHRVSDGQDGSAFLAAVERSLARPDDL
jgi:pyruvate dehydrogenase E2 component (dihydrolipoamide acetyltransferase)